MSRSSQRTIPDVACAVACDDLAACTIVMEVFELDLVGQARSEFIEAAIKATSENLYAAAAREGVSREEIAVLATAHETRITELVAEKLFRALKDTE